MVGNNEHLESFHDANYHSSTSKHDVEFVKILRDPESGFRVKENKVNVFHLLRHFFLGMEITKAHHQISFYVA